MTNLVWKISSDEPTITGKLSQFDIKSLEANYTHVPGIAAATILGDGRVALILDVDAVVGASRGQSLKAEMSYAAAG